MILNHYRVLLGVSLYSQHLHALALELLAQLLLLCLFLRCLLRSSETPGSLLIHLSPGGHTICAHVATVRAESLINTESLVRTWVRVETKYTSIGHHQYYASCAELSANRQQRHTNCHEQQLARPHIAEEAVDVVEHAEEDLRLGGRCWLQRHSTTIVRIRELAALREHGTQHKPLA